MPGVGSPGPPERCDHPDGCPLISSDDACNDSYGANEHDRCTVQCKSDPTLTTSYECVSQLHPGSVPISSGGAWLLVGPAITCPSRPPAPPAAPPPSSPPWAREIA